MTRRWKLRLADATVCLGACTLMTFLLSGWWPALWVGLSITIAGFILEFCAKPDPHGKETRQWSDGF